MTKVITPIIPEKLSYVGQEDELDYKAICFYAATNLFLGEDTHFKNKICLQPATEYEIQDQNIISEKKHFEWHYNPRNITFSEATDEFMHLFETMVHEKLSDKNVVLPLSGGLDSRSQAVSLIGFENVKTYSYEYPEGVPETKYAEGVARACHQSFQKLIIPKGYLWDVLEEVAELIHYEGDPSVIRQAAFMNDYKQMGDVLYLGHWGDVLFDDMGVSEQLSDEELVNALMKKIIKRKGLEIGEALWKSFGLSGDYKTELKDKFHSLLSGIKIDNNNAKVRAFKSLYWAPRWTSLGMAVFSKSLPVFLPYYKEEMCKFICGIPEEYLAGRRIQIEYIKRKSEAAAKVPWQSYTPCNLYNYKSFNSVQNIPHRAGRKLKRTLRSMVGLRPEIKRNWEIQYLGSENEKKLEQWLFHNPKFSSFVPSELVTDFYNKFQKEDRVEYAHSVSTLLSLSVFAKKKL